MSHFLRCDFCHEWWVYGSLWYKMYYHCWQHAQRVLKLQNLWISKVPDHNFWQMWDRCQTSCLTIKGQRVETRRYACSKIPPHIFQSLIPICCPNRNAVLSCYQRIVHLRMIALNCSKLRFQLQLVAISKIVEKKMQLLGNKIAENYSLREH